MAGNASTSVLVQGPPAPAPHPTNVEFVVFMRPWQVQILDPQIFMNLVA